jgi:hypothetical protein
MAVSFIGGGNRKTKCLKISSLRTSYGVTIVNGMNMAIQICIKEGPRLYEVQIYVYFIFSNNIRGGNIQ